MKSSDKSNCKKRYFLYYSWQCISKITQSYFINMRREDKNIMHLFINLYQIFVPVRHVTAEGHQVINVIRSWFFSSVTCIVYTCLYGILVSATGVSVNWKVQVTPPYILIWHFKRCKITGVILQLPILYHYTRKRTTTTCLSTSYRNNYKEEYNNNILNRVPKIRRL